MKNINFALLMVVWVVLIAFGGSWVFNHVNAWAGIGIVLVGIYLIVRKFVTKIQEKLEDEKT